MTVLKPRRGAWVPLLIVGVPISGLGIAGFLEDYSAWPWSIGAIALGLGVVGYNATVRLVLSSHEVALKRFGRTVWRTPLRGTQLSEGSAGTPAWIPAYVLSRNGEQVGFVLKNWFDARAISQLRDALANSVRFRPKADIGTERCIVHQTAMKIDTAPGERIIWQGQPTQGIRFAPQDLFAVPFAAFWLLIVLAILLLAATGEMRKVDPLTYIILPIFLLFGLHMLVGRFLVDRAARRRTHFYLTNQRAVIESGFFRPNRRSISLAALPEIRFRGGRKGRGTVQFGSPGMFGMIPPSWPGASQFLPPAFDDIDAAESVYERALAAQREAQGRS